ncbi:Uncharacterised protein [uncultured archaeon]|nr:Uncharacterised protein [uncultured archaeon]
MPLWFLNSTNLLMFDTTFSKFDPIRIRSYVALEPASKDIANLVKWELRIFSIK